MKWAAGSAKAKGDTKSKFKDSVKRSLLRILHERATDEFTVSRIKEAHQAIDEIWDDV